MKKYPLIFLSLFIITSCGNTPVEVFDTKENKPANVILLAGGEDCLGYSYTYHLQEHDGVSEEIFNEYVSGYDDVKISYKNMLNTNLIHKEETNFVATKIGQGKAPEEGIKYGCIGPEVGMAEYLSKFAPNEEFYIIKFAGGSSSSIQYEWNVDGGTYYKEMSSFFNNQLNKLTTLGVTYNVSSFVFIQGETDAKNGTLNYDYHLSKFINKIKLDYYKYAPENGMSFIDVGISSHYLINFRRINQNKKDIIAKDKNDFYIDTILANISRQKDNKDRLHYDALGQIKLGQLISKAILMKLDQKIEELEPYSFINESIYLEDASAKEFKIINNGKLITSLYNAKRVDNSLNVNVDIFDNNVNKDDGFYIEYVGASSSRTINKEDVKYLEVYANQNKILKTYYAVNDSLQEIDSSTINVSSSKLIKDKKNVGYKLNIDIPLEKNNDVYLNIGVIKNKNIIKNTSYNVDINDVNSFMVVDNLGIRENINYKNGEFFGSLSTNKMTYGWELSNDKEFDGSIHNPYGSHLNYCFAYINNSAKLKFKASFTAINIFNYDLYPKFGILLVDKEFNGIFYYVDAYGTNGYDMVGTSLGYCKINGGVFSDYVNFTYYAGVNASSLYLNNNYIELGIERDGDIYKFICNNYQVASLQNVTKFGLNEAYFGVNTYNVYTNIKNYGFY